MYVVFDVNILDINIHDEHSDLTLVLSAHLMFEIVITLCLYFNVAYLLFVQVSSKRVAGRLVCFGDNNFEWHRHYSKTT